MPGHIGYEAAGKSSSTGRVLPWSSPIGVFVLNGHVSSVFLRDCGMYGELVIAPVHVIVAVGWHDGSRGSSPLGCSLLQRTEP